MHAVVTGATSGIGEAIARRLAAEGLTVTVVGRDDERLKATGQRIESAVPNAGLIFERADLAELTQVRDLAGRLLAGPLPDVIISNAAVVTPLYRMTSDGLPRVLAINHLAPYLLLRTLAGSLDRARLIVVGADPVSLQRRRGSRRPHVCSSRAAGRACRTAAVLRLWPHQEHERDVHVRARAPSGRDRHHRQRRAPRHHQRHRPRRETPGIGELVRQAFRDGALPPARAPARAGRSARVDRFRPPPGPDVGADTPCWLATSADVEGGDRPVLRRPRGRRTALHTTDIERCRLLWEASADFVGLPA